MISDRVLTELQETGRATVVRRVQLGDLVEAAMAVGVLPQQLRIYGSSTALFYLIVVKPIDCPGN